MEFDPLICAGKQQRPRRLLPLERWIRRASENVLVIAAYNSSQVTMLAILMPVASPKA